MQTKKRKFGDLGEKLACKFLSDSGYMILGTNYRKRIGEIDIIAKLNETVCFVEVKTRTIFSNEKYGLPQEAVNYYKKKKLIRTALFYLLEHGYSGDTNWQIDVIAITVNEKYGEPKIDHIKNAVSLDDV